MYSPLREPISVEAASQSALVQTCLEKAQPRRVMVLTAAPFAIIAVAAVVALCLTAPAAWGRMIIGTEC
jgi:hypothetical protein